MSAVFVILIMTAVFLVMGLFLLRGRGKWLIAGYNTASKKEKEKYDGKKLCRAMGILCLTVAALLAVLAYLGWQVDSGRLGESAMLLFALVAVIVIVAALVLTSRYINRHAKK